MYIHEGNRVEIYGGKRKTHPLDSHPRCSNYRLTVVSREYPAPLVFLDSVTPPVPRNFFRPTDSPRLSDDPEKISSANFFSFSSPPILFSTAFLAPHLSSVVSRTINGYPSVSTVGVLEFRIRVTSSRSPAEPILSIHIHRRNVCRNPK